MNINPIRIKFTPAIFFVIALLYGCTSSTVQQPNFYVLYSSAESIDLYDDISSMSTILLQPVELSHYLKKSNIMMQITDNEMYFSPYHLWAEPLQSGIFNAISHNIQNNTRNFQVVDKQSSVASNPEYDIVLEIRNFHIIDRSSVVLSGKFTIKNEGEGSIKSIVFSKRLPLEKNGYAYAVAQMAELLEGLSKNIVAELE